MADMEKVIYSIERCICHVPDACRDCGYDNEPCPKCFEHLLLDAHDLLKAQEATDANTGKWTTKRTQEHDGEWYCSECGYEPVVMTDDMKYCPGCGRKMTMPEPPKGE